MSKTKSQNDRILAYLETGRSLTALQALEKFGCMRLASRICELSMRCFINTEMVINKKTGKRYAKYKLERG